MSFINTRKKEINCKIAYVGPAFSGKTTTLKYIHKKMGEGRDNKITTLSGANDDTLFFDFLPLALGAINGYKVHIHLYTVPGQIIYDSSRTLILRGIDGIVFVADSHLQKLEENLESWNNLGKSLKNAGIDLKSIPTVLQYNKRDISDCMPLQELQTLFNSRDFPAFETIATQGKNVVECFQEITKKVLQGLK